MMGSNDRRVVVTMSTENDWRESFASNSEVPLAEWTHVVVRCEARQRSVTIFLNGLPDGEHRLSSPAKPNPHPFYLGQPPEGVVTVPSCTHTAQRSPRAIATLEEGCSAISHVRVM
jgi:hypothetical protein